MASIWPGKPYPLGATWDGQGTNFALFSANATRVELCLFDRPDAPREATRHALPERSEDVWHGYIPGVAPGQLYGYRVDKGLSNYWGYQSLGFFAPDARYASAGGPGAAVAEFKQMVRQLHVAGIEVILDVVYNHTGEGNQLGPTLSFRGIDNAAYYRLVPDNPRYYMDYTGTGNSLNTANPRVLQLVIDSLRYWVSELHVDGFRFDLARTLFQGPLAPDSAEYDVEWLSPDGQEISPALWNNPELRCFGLLLNGRVMVEQDASGRPIHDDVLLILYNAGHDAVPFILPDWPDDPVWEVLVDTSDPAANGDRALTSEIFLLPPRSLVLLAERTDGPPPPPRPVKP